MTDLAQAIARLNRSVWDIRVIPNREDVRDLLNAHRLAINPEPSGDKPVWYRGWECSYNTEAALWGCDGWVAYLGGPDLDCIQTSALTWAELLDEIDDHDMTERQP